MQSEMKTMLEKGAGSVPPTGEFAPLWNRSLELRRRRRAAGALGALCAIAILAVGSAYVVGALGTNAAESDLEPSQGGQFTPSGTWTKIPKAPIEGRVEPVVVWTGSEMLVWGGEGHSDGAAYNPVTGDWKRIAPSPLGAAEGRRAVWTGSEMIVWGGRHSDGRQDAPDSGAAYDHASNSWRRLHESPGWSLGGHSLVWTGEEAIAFGGTVSGGVLAAAYNPDAGSWRRLAAPPIEGRDEHLAVWTGAEMIVWGGRDLTGELLSDGAAYDPATDSWEVLPAAPLQPRESAVAAWTGEEMVVWGGATDRKLHAGLSDAAAYNPASRSWRKIPGRASLNGYSASPLWTGSQIIAMGLDPDSTVYEMGIAAFDVKSERWARLRPAPEPVGLGAAAVWTGSEMLVWGGSNTTPPFEEPPRGGLSYRPE